MYSFGHIMSIIMYWDVCWHWIMYMKIIHRNKHILVLESAPVPLAIQLHLCSHQELHSRFKFINGKPNYHCRKTQQELLSFCLPILAQKHRITHHHANINPSCPHYIAPQIINSTNSISSTVRPTVKRLST